MEELVLKERRRELLFEGKRWFDLVRMARRDGNTERLTQLVLLKYTENVSAVRIKLADMNAIYWPILKDELKINTLLKQNPAYEEDEFIEKNQYFNIAWKLKYLEINENFQTDIQIWFDGGNYPDVPWFVNILC